MALPQATAARGAVRMALQTFAVAGLLSASLVTSTAAQNTAAIGGSGQLTLSGVTCFKSGSKMVPLVCGEPVVHYKVTTLMGDPLGNYGVSWKVFSFHIADADGKRSENYLAGSVPAPIWDARQSVELSLYGFAKVRPPNVSSPSTALQFDTGVGVKATGEVSLNVPSGYNWDRFLVVASSGAGPDWACSDQSRPADPQEAKKLMRGGFELFGLYVCPRTSVNVDRLERAISAWCDSRVDNRPKYCPPKDEEEAAQQQKAKVDPFAALGKPPVKRPAGAADKDPFAVLNDRSTKPGAAAPPDMNAALAKAEADRVAAVEYKRRREVTRATCERDLALQESCRNDSCGNEPARDICVRRSSEPDNRPHCPPPKQCIFLANYPCLEEGPNPAHDQWKRCLVDTATQCAALGQKIISVSSCVSERMSQNE